MEQTFVYTPIQKQKMTQNQILSLNILAMDNWELNKFLQNEYNENPMFDHVYCNPNQTSPYTSSNHNDSYFREVKGNDSDQNLLFFLEQLDPSMFSSYEWNVLKLMILLLDEHGFFPYSCLEISEHYNLSEKLVEDCLSVLQSLEPCGIFQPDSKHYYIYQLQKKRQDTPSMLRIVNNHLENMASGNLKKIADDLNLSISETRILVHAFKKLSPTPLNGVYFSSSDYITPDILAHYENGLWEFTINDNWIGNYSLNDYYIQMMNQTDNAQLKKYFREKYNRSVFILQRIEQRRQTILSICHAIVNRQKQYFSNAGPLVPMSMSDIAYDLNLSVSTISRGIKNKYLQYPGGTILIKSLFTQGISNSNNTSFSCSTIISEMKKIIASENKKKPYSDSQLAKILQQQNIHISRRTIAKYRLLANIPNTLDRRET